MDLTEFMIPASARLVDAADAIEHNHNRAIVVVEGKKVLGIISEGDILRALLRDADIHAPILDFVNFSFKFLKERDVNGALALFRQYGISLIPVVDDNFHFQDVITLGDILSQVTLDRPS